MKTTSAAGTVLFISADPLLSLYAHSRFTSEAEKLDVSWTSTPRCSGNAIDGSESAMQAELLAATGLSYDDVVSSCPALLLDSSESFFKDFSLVISVGTPGLANQLPDKKPEHEAWTIQSSSQALEQINSLVSSLMVKLILRGGKRASTTDIKPSVSVHQPDCNSKAGKNQSLKNMPARVSLDSKGRGGKKVTVVSGLTLDETKLNNLAAELKQSCGTGGTVKDGVIEIQGDKRTQVMTELQKRGYRPKRSGG